MRAAKIIDGIVDNIIEVDSLDVFPDLVDAGDCCIGDLWNGSVFSKPPSIPPSRIQIETAIQQSLDLFSQSWGYNDIASACTYVGDPCDKFNSEAVVLRKWRSDTWLQVETTDAEILAGTKPYPATMEEALSILPHPPVRPS